MSWTILLVGGINCWALSRMIYCGVIPDKENEQIYIFSRRAIWRHSYFSSYPLVVSDSASSPLLVPCIQTPILRSHFLTILVPDWSQLPRWDLAVTEHVPRYFPSLCFPAGFRVLWENITNVSVLLCASYFCASFIRQSFHVTPWSHPPTSGKKQFNCATSATSNIHKDLWGIRWQTVDSEFLRKTWFVSLKVLNAVWPVGRVLCWWT